MALLPQEALDEIRAAWKEFLDDDGPQFWCLSGDVSEVGGVLQELVHDTKRAVLLSISSAGGGIVITKTESKNQNSPIQLVGKLAPPLVGAVNGVAATAAALLWDIAGPELTESPIASPDLSTLFAMIRVLSLSRPVVLLLDSLMASGNDATLGLVQATLSIWRSLVQTDLSLLVVVAEPNAVTDDIRFGDLNMRIRGISAPDIRSEGLREDVAQLVLDVTLDRSARDVREFVNYLKRWGILVTDGFGGFRLLPNLSGRAALRSGFATEFRRRIPASDEELLKYALCQGRFVSTWVLCRASGRERDRVREFLRGDTSPGWIYEPYTYAADNEDEVGHSDDLFVLRISEPALRWLRLGADVHESAESRLTLAAAQEASRRGGLSRQWLRDIADIAGDKALATTLRPSYGGAVVVTSYAEVKAGAEIGLELSSIYVSDPDVIDEYISAVVQFLEPKGRAYHADSLQRFLVSVMRVAEPASNRNKALLASQASRFMQDLPSDVQLGLSRAAIILAREDINLRDHLIALYIVDLIVAGSEVEALELGVSLALRVRRRFATPDGASARQTYCNINLHLAFLYLILERPKHANRAFKRARGKSSIRAESEMGLAVSYALLGQRVDALAAWDVAYDIAMRESKLGTVWSLLCHRRAMVAMWGEAYDGEVDDPWTRGVEDDNPLVMSVGNQGLWPDSNRLSGNNLRRYFSLFEKEVEARHRRYGSN